MQAVESIHKRLASAQGERQLLQHPSREEMRLIPSRRDSSTA